MPAETSFSKNVVYTFTSDIIGSMEKTIYVWFNDSQGNPSQGAFDSIFINQININDYKLPDTGQSESFTNTFGEDNDYNFNIRSFEKNGDGTVLDRNTSLIWQEIDSNLKRSWAQSESYCLDLNLAGYDDWRLPRKYELQGLVDYGKSNPSIDSNIFPNTKPDYYWTSDLYSKNIYSDAWYIYFVQGNSYISDTDNKYYVKCVRGTTLNKLYIKNNNENVIDNLTGITWQNTFLNANWEYAINYCEELVLNSYSDWRLPNVNELVSIIDLNKNDPALSSKFSYLYNGFWSSTTDVWNQNLVHTVDLSIGYITTPPKTSIHNFMCIRGGNNTQVSFRIPKKQIISTGEKHTCTVFDNQSIKCWGGGSYRSKLGLGIVTDNDSLIPTNVVELINVKSISAGDQHTCALLYDGSIKCWGEGNVGQLGIGNTCNEIQPTQSNIPKKITSNDNFSYLSVGSKHTCALTIGGKNVCWGYSANGRTGQGSEHNTYCPSTAFYGGGAIQVSAGWGHTCVVNEDGKIRCWGGGGQGELGNGSQPSNQFNPVDVSGISNAVEVSAGGDHTCALLQTGKIMCWGYNGYGQLGIGNTITQTTPVEVSNIDNATQTSAGYLHSCAVLEGGDLKCWGNNTKGELGDGTTTAKNTPVSVINIDNVSQVSAGFDHTCALTGKGDTKCWGSGDSGKLGNGETNAQLTPVSVQYRHGHGWTKAALSEFSGRSGHTINTFNNKLWLLGGVFSGGQTQKDLWNSDDGISWSRVTDNGIWQNRYGHSTLVFENKLWLIAGDQITGLNDVWNTSDGINWTKINNNAQWQINVNSRTHHTSVVFNNKMWVLGGEMGYRLNDVWSSSDGITWKEEASTAAWSKRYQHSSVVFGGKMWVIGGDDGSALKNDVWYSPNGVSWTEATSNAPWSKRFAHTTVVHDGKIWVIGGFDGTKTLNDVWYSIDGVNWTSVANIPWTERMDSSSVVFQDRIWLLGGDDDNNPNNSHLDDVWFSNGKSDFTLYGYMLPDTGQTESYTNTFGEDSDYTINPPSYTDNGDGTVTDRMTGLMWQREDDNLARGWNAAVSYCDGFSLAGHGDWRLPVPSELMSLVDFGTYEPMIFGSFFTNISFPYWSSVSFVGNTNLSWEVDLGAGIVSRLTHKDYGRYARCVRGTLTQVHSFTDHRDGTVTDLRTGLMWQKHLSNSPSGGTWVDALNACEGSAHAGYDDWRLPNIRELESLVDASRALASPAADTDVFPYTQMWYYWSSTTYVGNTSEAWSIEFRYGDVGNRGKEIGGHVRCVR